MVTICKDRYKELRKQKPNLRVKNKTIKRVKCNGPSMKTEKKSQK